MELLTQIFQICVIPLLGILTKYLVSYLNAKRKELKVKTDNEIASKYIDMISQTITDCVIATNQTYVDSLKASGKFDEEAQKKAFNSTLEAVLTILSDDAKDYIANITGDMNAYLINQIEATVNNKKGTLF